MSEQEWLFIIMICCSFFIKILNNNYIISCRVKSQVSKTDCNMCRTWFQHQQTKAKKQWKMISWRHRCCQSTSCSCSNVATTTASWSLSSNVLTTYSKGSTTLSRQWSQRSTLKSGPSTDCQTSCGTRVTHATWLLPTTILANNTTLITS